MANKYVCVDVYTVQAGDTLYSIAQRCNVDVGLLMRANRVHNPYNLRIGTKLCIPGPAQEESVPRPLPEINPGENPEPGPQPPESPEPQPDTPPEQCCRETHTVKAGDTLYMIAKMHKVTLDALMNANPKIDPYNLQIGTEICIPL
ncbi:LysM peptidoglycan-binding domain-containing protein [Anaerovorax odorimutans]|uniref:LysM peptidoglycan-binding domain-containing protein n=1 Tax=Anaerovorax odorimutans TaxID=109327 RepID=A0ABT1RJY3_9FIRM|nr:LysM peptidoglycan-binding domain-containing protein [Anaerovorax odorimutans]MCQ4635497.1 LysM peptidoglycan-binding domain-containing protein [Anaerovorax odorimutans]